MSEERLVDIKYHFSEDVDPCTHCRNINKCINQHWKRCKPSLKSAFFSEKIRMISRSKTFLDFFH